jgi:hypothetical protein
MSKLFSIDIVDIGKAALMAGLTVVVTGVGAALQSGALPGIAGLVHLGTLGLGAAVAYLIKNFFTNSSGAIAAAEQTTPPANGTTAQ